MLVLLVWIGIAVKLHAILSYCNHSPCLGDDTLFKVRESTYLPRRYPSALFMSLNTYIIDTYIVDYQLALYSRHVNAPFAPLVDLFFVLSKPP